MFKSITDNGYNGFYQVVEFCLEDSTERSESNPGRSLGIITKEKSTVLLEHFSLKINVFSYYLRGGGFHKKAVF